MPLQKLTLKPGINRENTRYTSETGWYESDKIRFRQGTPESIGGWQRISANTFLGICRSLWNWITLGGLNLLGVGTNSKFYIENGGAYIDVTPNRATVTLTNPFSTTSGSNVVSVTDPLASNCKSGDYVTFYNSSAVGGLTILGEYQITYSGSGSVYTITAGSNASSTATGGGTVYAVYQVNIMPPIEVPLVGWGAGAWGSGVWGTGGSSTVSLGIWNQTNWGQDLLFGQRGGPLYYWSAQIGLYQTAAAITIASPAVVTATTTVSEGQSIAFDTTGALPTGLLPGVVYFAKNVSGSTFNLAATAGGTAINTSGTQSGTHSLEVRGVPLSTLSGISSYAPQSQQFFLVSDASRFCICFGTNDAFSTTVDPMLVRWSDQESLTQWTPSATNQAGSVRLSRGSNLITAIQSRQEIFVWTDSAVYGMQYVGDPVIWSTQLLGDNVSIIGPNGMAVASNIVFWMGADKFYMYDGAVKTLKCDLRQFIYDDINLQQVQQVFAATNEGFNEVWFFYCSAASNTVDRYVVYNYLENVWYYGTMARTAWLDTGLRSYPVAATYLGNIVSHEYGVDNMETAVAQPINAYVQSAQFDIGDGDHMAFVWRLLPDLTFRGSTAGTNPVVTFTLQPLKNSGSGYNVPKSIAGPNSNANATVTGTAFADVDEFTGQVYIRIRGRQMSMRIESNKVGTHWQLGSPRIDIRSDGRR